MKLQIFAIKKSEKKSQTHTCLAVVSLDSPLKKDDKYNLQVFLKEYKYIEKNVVRHIYENFSDFSYSSDESDKLVVFQGLINTKTCLYGFKAESYFF